jgi:D-tagatose-1,6-bisphosphate aldolase subunit GatZ/KbaZ
MTPKDFRDYVYAIGEKVNFESEKIILGADHFGPLVWSNLPVEEAMKNSKELVRLAVLAGFTKIHIDTSMKLKGDPVDERLSDEVIAERSAVLIEECGKAYQELLKTEPNAIRPVYIIGSEVPIPGGAQEKDAGLQVTSASDFENTLNTYKRKFDEHGISDVWADVIAVVVQPGVEFGDNDIHQYDRNAAVELCSALKRHTNVVFEGHSTDYQPPKKLREMVEDGIAILKVGPALTFALREGLFALSMIEKELVPEEKRANFIETLERIMLANPSNWQKHYHGSDEDKRLARKYSYSDRCRYYFSLPEIKDAIRKLFANIDSVEVPAGMLRQYMPRQYRRVRDGLLEMKAAALAKDSVAEVADDYNYAVKLNYIIGGIF